MTGDICRGADAWPGCPLQQRLIKGVQNLIQLKNVVKPICDKIFYDDIEFTAVGQSVACLLYTSTQVSEVHVMQST